MLLTLTLAALAAMAVVYLLRQIRRVPLRFLLPVLAAFVVWRLGTDLFQQFSARLSSWGLHFAPWMEQAFWMVLGACCVLIMLRGSEFAKCLASRRRTLRRRNRDVASAGDDGMGWTSATRASTRPAARYASPAPHAWYSPAHEEAPPYADPVYDDLEFYDDPVDDYEVDDYEIGGYEGERSRGFAPSPTPPHRTTVERVDERIAEREAGGVTERVVERTVDRFVFDHDGRDTRRGSDER